MEHGRKFLELVEDARRRIKEISLEEVKRRLDAGEHFRLVDVREESEWAQGHLPRAEHLGKGILERDAEETLPDPDAEVVLYCGGGYRSALAADNLGKMGYTQVKSMAGGVRGWKNAGFPLILP